MFTTLHYHFGQNNDGGHNFSETHAYCEKSGKLKLYIYEANMSY